MRIENNRYYDENNNSWSCELETMESAELKSKSLVNCFDCRDCIDCSNCRDCRRCSDCRSCIDCSSCIDCRDCSDCSYCRDCSSCRDCIDCIYCRSCSCCLDCSDCRSCSDCLDCRSCSYFKNNPQKYTTKRIGSRNSQTNFYWNTKDDIQVVCGCFRGNLEEFEAKVKKTHGENEHAINYLKEIEKVKLLLL